MGVANWTAEVGPGGGPGAIDFVSADEPLRGKRALGVYRLKGDRLTICFGEFGGGKRPSFDTTGGEPTTFWVLKRRQPK